MRLAAQIRSLLGVVGLVVWLIVGEIWERLVVWPAMLLRPARAPAVIAWYMKGMSDGIFGFIARPRYGRWVPSVSLCMRLLGCPLIEPENRKGSLRALREATRAQPHGIVVFPEGHRTRDGEIQAFHTAGLEIMLRERPRRRM